MMAEYDVVVVGGGPGGLAAAAAAKRQGAERVLLLERENTVGGVLNQCIHDGFGLHRYKAQLSGPEYAEYSEHEAVDAGVEIRTGFLVTSIGKDHVVTAISREGMCRFEAKAVVLATGCRERTKGAISIPGSRPAGIFTAGVAQNLINRMNIMVGRRVVILGSGDIGLIMARRLTLEGAQVLAVVEMMETPGGLTRNISQCLYDFDIPLYLEHTVSRIIGKKRLEAVEISKVDKDKRIVPESSWEIECDTLILSVGLIPENELAKDMGVRLDDRTNGVLTDDYLQTSIPGIFSCGNSRQVMDLADFVSEQGELAGRNATRYTLGDPLECWEDERSVGFLQKGLPVSGTVICTLCPNGCQVLVKDGEGVEGNRCVRGKEFALQEHRAPERILTTTVRVTGASVPIVAVRSDRPVKKSELCSLANELHKRGIQAPIAPGQVLYTNVGENNVNIVAEHKVEKKQL